MENTEIKEEEMENYLKMIDKATKNKKNNKEVLNDIHEQNMEKLFGTPEQRRQKMMMSIFMFIIFVIVLIIYLANSEVLNLYR